MILYDNVLYDDTVWYDTKWYCKNTVHKWTCEEVDRKRGFLVNIRFLLPASIRAIRFVFVRSAA